LEICAKEAFDGKDEIQAIDLLRYEEAVELFLEKYNLKSENIMENMISHFTGQELAKNKDGFTDFYYKYNKKEDVSSLYINEKGEYLTQTPDFLEKVVFEGSNIQTVAHLAAEDSVKEHFDDIENELVGWLAEDGTFYPCGFGLHAKELYNHPEWKKPIYVGVSTITAEGSISRAQKYFFYANFNKLSALQKDELLKKLLY